ncbi:hypothetical protein E1283_01535 [Streptomyces hainanensis]|uniref:Uncharacterized protein n=1 Tax=Streptomyces hainanensis TaxID=402648 RepID=A0A4R4TPE5_9ACTN|nr:hypothetical protein E1283_01535 [Streptomyces hainanensis]
MNRLVTHAELDEAHTAARQLSVSARLEAVLADGRALVLLADRGWSSSLIGAADLRDGTSVEDIVDTARTVVGPDEPIDGQSQEQAAAAHWSALADILARQGVDADPRELARLPHDVVLGARLRDWLTGS